MSSRSSGTLTELLHNIVMLAMLLFGLFVILPFVVVAGLYSANHPKADLLLNGLVIYLLVLLVLVICIVS